MKRFWILIAMTCSFSGLLAQLPNVQDPTFNRQQTSNSLPANAASPGSEGRSNEYSGMLGGHSNDVLRRTGRSGAKAYAVDLTTERKHPQSALYVRSILEASEKEDRHYSSNKRSDNSNPIDPVFTEAYTEIDAMLQDGAPQLLKRAVFLTENALLENSLDYEDFDQQIKAKAEVIRFKMNQMSSPNSNLKINEAAFQFMTEPWSIEMPSLEKTVTTKPVTYDFEDPFGYDDLTKPLVSKLMSEQSGQCKSLPLYYLLLIEELNGEAYLSFSPSHSFIKCKRKNGSLYNVELTNGHLTSDAWVIGSGFIKAESIRSGLYLDTLNKKQVIANCLVDLARYYTYRTGSLDEFVLKCINKALDIHPVNIYALQLKSDYYTARLSEVAYRRGYEDEEQVSNDPYTKHLLKQRNQMYALLDQLGYEPIPDQVYNEWLHSMEEENSKTE